METFYFVYSWDISDSQLNGPFDTLEDATDYAMDLEDLENSMVVQMPGVVIPRG